MTDLEPAFNYRYFVDHAAKVGGLILDYGCGAGKIVAQGLDRGLDIWGADTYSGYGWASALEPRLRDRVRTIRDGVTDLPDGQFDLVISNQVLEHVTDPEAVIADIFRMISRHLRERPCPRTGSDIRSGPRLPYVWRRGQAFQSMHETATPIR